MRYHSVLIIIISCFLVTSCKSTKKLSEDKDVVSERVALRNFKENQPSFKTINGKIKALYTSEDETQSLNITYRIEKDKTIWLSAKLMGLLTVAKVLVTPEEVKFYEKINKTYFEGDFSIAKKYLGVEINFEQLQNLLLGINFYPIKKKSLYYSAPNYISITEAQPFMVFKAVLDAKQFKLTQQSLANQNRSLQVNYDKFRKLNQQFFPEELRILAKENQSVIHINLDFKSVTLNEDLRFPFSIPSNYKPIEL